MCLAISIIYVGCIYDKKVEDAYLSTTTSFGISTSNCGAYQILLKEFSEQYTNIHVVDNSMTADDNWKSLIRSKFEAGQEPDVMFFFTATDAEKIVSNKQVVSIDEIRKEYKDFASNIRPEAFEAVKEKDGKAYCVPIMEFWEGLYCNKELFEQYNVPMITDWDSLIYAIKTFNENGVTPIAASLSDEPNYWFEHSILSCSGIKKHSINPKSPSEVPAEWIEGFNLLNKLYKMNAFQDDTFTTKHQLSVQLFNSGMAAMILDGSWMRVQNDMQPKVKVVPFPYLDKINKDDKGVISGCSMGFYISTKAWKDPVKKEACVKFVEFMTSNESIIKLCTAGAPASNVELPLDSLPVTKEGFNLCNNNKSEMPIDSRLSKSAWEYLLLKIPFIIKGELDPKQILETMTEYNNEI